MNDCSENPVKTTLATSGVGQMLCYLVDGSIVKYAKKLIVTDGVSAITYVDKNGAQIASLPAGAEEVDCKQVVYPAACGCAESGSVVEQFAKTITIEALADNTSTPPIVVAFGVDVSFAWAINVVGYAGQITHAQLNQDGDLVVVAFNNTGDVLPTATVAVTLAKS